MDNQQSDAAWTRWYELLHSIGCDLTLKEKDSALSRIESFLAGEIDPEIRSEALGMKAEIREQAGQFEEAKQTLLAARKLVGPSFRRYAHELCLGSLCRRQGQIEGAILWYTTALQTCLDGPGFSAGAALGALFSLKDPKTLTSEEHNLCVQVAVRSWSILRLVGEPDTADLLGVALAIREREASGPPRHPSD